MHFGLTPSIVCAGIASIAFATTSVYTDTGCIRVDDQSTCKGWGYSPAGIVSSGPEASATISVGFPLNQGIKYASPSCQMVFTWPAYYANVFITSSYCLVDEGRQRKYSGILWGRMGGRCRVCELIPREQAIQAEDDNHQLKDQCCTKKYNNIDITSPYFILKYGPRTAGNKDEKINSLDSSFNNKGKVDAGSSTYVMSEPSSSGDGLSSKDATSIPSDDDSKSNDKTGVSNDEYDSILENNVNDLIINPYQDVDEADSRYFPREIVAREASIRCRTSRLKKFWREC